VAEAAHGSKENYMYIKDILQKNPLKPTLVIAKKKRHKEEKTSPILTLIIKFGLVFFLGKDYCPTLYLHIFRILEANGTNYWREHPLL
jgi:hypothetical protein